LRRISCFSMSVALAQKWSGPLGADGVRLLV
jgi:hypothetical protein